VLTVEGDPQASKETPGFDQSFLIDLDVDDRMDRVRFSKPPLELRVSTKEGVALRLIGAHLKSKAPHGADNAKDVVRLAIANRRKQLAQAIWLHRRVTDHIEAGEHVIVMGDLNDGPGLDEYERLFGKSSVEIVMGSELTDPHAQRLLKPRETVLPSTSRFYNPETKSYLRALLDYIMISHGLEAYAPRWRIWHPFEDAECYDNIPLREALLAASDHFPVSLDLELT
jgi:endonuclease/exonuclease/phosphatase family metal-dependent hydrolase